MTMPDNPPAKSLDELEIIREAREYIKADSHSPDGYAEDLVRRLLTASVALVQVEREACAKIADSFVRSTFALNEAEIAQLIRARSTTPLPEGKTE